MTIPLWITIALQALYYFWCIIEATALANIVWHNSNPYWVKAFGKMRYTDIGLKCSIWFIIVTVFYFSYYINS